MYVYVYITCMHVCIDLYVFMYVYICIHIYFYVCLHIYLYRARGPLWHPSICLGQDDILLQDDLAEQRALGKAPMDRARLRGKSGACGLKKYNELPVKNCHGWPCFEKVCK